MSHSTWILRERLKQVLNKIEGNKRDLKTNAEYRAKYIGERNRLANQRADLMRAIESLGGET